MSNANETHASWELPKNELIAKLEDVFAVQDYPPGRRCIRLSGINRNDFETSAFNQNLAEVFLLDLAVDDAAKFPSYNEFVRYSKLTAEEEGNLRRWPNEPLNQTSVAYQTEFGNIEHPPRLMDPTIWVRVKYQIANEPTSSYGYCLFRGVETPTYLDITDVEIFRAQQIVNPPPLLDAISKKSIRAAANQQADATVPLLRSFDVGQGMCSLTVGGGLGALVDCGAGTPIKRPAYLAGSLINELSSAISGLVNLIAVVSHADSDHWRLLDWDTALQSKVMLVLVPSGVGILAFTSPALTGKVFSTGDYTIPIGLNAHLDLYRTQPLITNSNGNALVAHLHTNEFDALLPGDYVYIRFASDLNPNISALLDRKYDALVIPHHGCGASFSNVPSPKIPGRSIAFVSAGDHLGYRHPRFISLQAHSMKDFRIANDKTARNVFSTILLP